jgi:DNA polymerase III delta prime subunit
MTNIDKNVLWCERYRPSKIEDCILSDGVKASFLEFALKKEVPNLLLSGTAGVGKTTVAKALCEEVGCDYLVINGSDDRGISTMQTTVKNYATSVSLMGGRKVIIIDEADNLTTDAQKALRGMIEEVSMNCSFIFTCNFKNKILEPIHSRCSVIDFKVNGSKAKMASAFFKRVEYILTKENIKYDKEVVAAVITKHFPDNRRVLNELQRYAVSGTIDKGILAAVSDIQINDLIKALKVKDFGSARKWVTNNLDNDASKIYRKLYDSFYDVLKPDSIPQSVLILAKYQYQSAFVADHEINMVACLTEIMVECEFK